MNKSKDIIYHCSKCPFTFPVKDYISKDIIKLGKKAFCPRCDSNKYTNRSGEKVIKTTRNVTSLDSPPSEGQLSYIKGLGGDARNVKTKREAGEYIGKLKKEKGL